ncbi:MAG: hypothetical protein U1D25_04975 [Hydrogenophaga sp.]|nr:hypothetical protein [Hydrogenophaga sp.]MDZ4187453.1 hypothetical protein [Hydrogenophaga sp.]
MTHPLHLRQRAAFITTALFALIWLVSITAVAQTNSAAQTTTPSVDPTVQAAPNPVIGVGNPNATADNTAPSSAANTPEPPPLSTLGTGQALPPAPVVNTAPPENCNSLSDRAMAVDLQAATTQSNKQDTAKLVKLVDEAIALWTLAVERCEGRAQERARRNLADSERSRAGLDAELGASPACINAQKNATSLQDLAQQAVRERRWIDAAVFYSKAENMWDLAAERCTGEAQKTALQKRDQTAVDAHNAEFCAPVFERARDQSQKLRSTSAGLSTAERQTQSQIAETLWREAQVHCKGQALDLARNNAQSQARDRGTPWVATALPEAPAVALVPAIRSAPASLTVANAAPAVKAATASATLPTAPMAATAATAERSAPPATATTPAKELDIQAGDTRFTGLFTRDGEGLSGNGQVRWANGDHYRGDLIKSRRHGQGEFVWASGQRYIGSWINDEPQGQGLLVFANGNRYEGEVARGLPHGKGRMLFATGDRFEGHFNQGRPDGQGHYHWVNGQHYEGPWVNEQPHGVGKLHFANGNVFEGQLVHGTPEGQGTLRFASGERYEGAISKGQPHGQGTFHWPNGDQYTGLWQQGKKHGQGRMTWANGDRWEGVYENDAQTSNGTLTRKSPP